MIFQGTTKREIEPQVSISRSYSGGDSTISITVQDKKSGQHIVEMSLTLEEFAKAVTGQVITISLPAVAYLNDCIGKMYECKTVLVPLTDSIDEEWEKFKVFAENYCEQSYPGWKMDAIGNRNRHNVRHMDNEKVYEVIIRRWL